MKKLLEHFAYFTTLTFISLSFMAPYVLADVTKAVIGGTQGTYNISGLENLNYFTGSVQFKVPLFSIHGRGEFEYKFEQSTQNLWYTTNQLVPIEGCSECYDTYTTFLNKGNAGGFSPPSIGRNEKNQFEPWPPPAVSKYSARSLTFFTVTTPDGTRHELYDVQTSGNPYSGIQTGNPTPESARFLRGTVFKSTDGSNITFVSNGTVGDRLARDPRQFSDQDYFRANGTVFFPNGIRYIVEHGKTVKIKDRNGNTTSFEYEPPPTPNPYNDIYRYGRVTKITQSDGRAITISYGNLLYPQGPPEEEWYNTVTYKGFQGADRIIKIYFNKLNQSLRSAMNGYPAATIKTIRELFINSPFVFNETYNPVVLSKVEYPNGQTYEIKYNSYSEVSQVVLPTGGMLTYEYGSGFQGSSDSGAYGTYNGLEINRRVLERRMHDENSVVLSVNKFSQPHLNNTSGQFLGFVDDELEAVDENGQLLPISKTKRFYHGNPIIPYNQSATYLANVYKVWNEGKEYKSEVFDGNGTNLLRTNQTTWQQKNNTSVPWWTTSSGIPEPANNPREIDETNVLNDSNQISKKTFTFDSENNKTDTYEYDYGTGSVGPFVKRTHTSFVSDPSYISHTGAHLVGLPSESWISSDISGNNKGSLVQFEYDNYSPDSNHDSLVYRTNVVGHDVANYGVLSTVRGNTTAVTKYIDGNTQNGPITGYSQYDVLGNSVKSIDAKGFVSTIDYTDRFGVPDGETQSNTPPGQLNGQSVFAYVTSGVNAKGWITGYEQRDYFTGAVVNTEDVNGLTGKTFYEDPLDRPTEAITSIGTQYEAHAKTIYYDVDRRIETVGDLFALNDDLTKTENVYDALGRKIESRKYEDGGNYVASKFVYDGLGQTRRVCNPFRPAQNEAPVWISFEYDALGRTIEQKTADGAKILTSYLGNAVTTIDQSGAQRRFLTNTLGQMTRVDEPDSWGQLGSVLSPQQATNYLYDPLGNLKNINQGVQTRTFAYDGLSRLTSMNNPESGVVSYLYDNNGNVTKRTDARNVDTNYIYDSLNRVTSRSYTDVPGIGTTTPTVTYTYDDLPNAKGKVTKVENAYSTTTYTAFDLLGRVTKSNQTTNAIVYDEMTYTYNLSGRMVETKYPSGRIVKSHLDNEGRPERTISKKDDDDIFRLYVNNYKYSASGAVESMQYGNGKFETTAYNIRLQPTVIGIGHSAINQGLLKLEYDYGELNNNGNVKSQTITVPTIDNNQGFTAVQTYTYDELNRIKEASETGTGGWTQTFQYDRYGNRNFSEGSTTTLTKQCGTAPDFAVCPNDRKRENPEIDVVNNHLKQFQPDGDQLSDYEYDAAGNTIKDPSGRLFRYDAENKQVKVIQLDSNGNEISNIGEYFFDGGGQRVKKIVPSTGETTIFHYDATGKLIAEYSTVVTPSTTAQVSYLTSDNLGSQRIITDATGQVISRRDFQPFGEEIARPIYGTNSVRQKFTSYERDIEAELDFAQARMYVYNHGRFTSSDPYNIILDAQDAEQEKPGNGEKLFSDYISQPQNWNRYVYVWNNPLKNIDPDGEKVYVIIYTVGNPSGDDEFRRAAYTQAAAIRKDGKFDPKKDIVIVEAVRSKKDVQKAFDMANALGGNAGWGDVQQVQIFSHAGAINGPVFHQDGSKKTEQFSSSELKNLTINWESGGEGYFFGCYTANFAQNFANAQGVTAYGNKRFSYFSSDPNKRVGPNSTGPLYLFESDGTANGTYSKYFWGNSERYPMVKKTPE